MSDPVAFETDPMRETLGVSYSERDDTPRITSVQVPVKYAGGGVTRWRLDGLCAVGGLHSSRGHPPCASRALIGRGSRCGLLAVIPTP